MKNISDIFSPAEEEPSVCYWGDIHGQLIHQEDLMRLLENKADLTKLTPELIKELYGKNLGIHHLECDHLELFDKFKSDIAANRFNLDKLVTDIKSLTAKVSSVDQEITLVNSEVQRVSDNVDQVHNLYDNLNSKYETLRTTQDVIRKDVSSGKIMTSALDTRVTALELGGSTTIDDVQRDVENIKTNISVNSNMITSLNMIAGSADKRSKENEDAIDILKNKMCSIESPNTSSLVDSINENHGYIVELQNIVNEHDDRIQSSEGHIADVCSRLCSTEGVVIDLNDRVGCLEHAAGIDVTELVDAVEGMQDQVNINTENITSIKEININVSSDVTTIKEEISVYEIILDSIRSEININNKKIEVLEQTSGGYDQEFADVHKAVAGMTNQYNDIKSTVDAFKNNFDTVNATIALTNSDVSALRKESQAIKTSIETLTGRVDGFANLMHNLETQVTDALAEVGELKETVSSYDAKFKTLEDSNAQMGVKVDSLEDRIDGLGAGGGTGESYDDTEVRNLIKENRSSIDFIGGKVNDSNHRIDSIDRRVTNLEAGDGDGGGEVIPPPPTEPTTPTKWYVLPIAGQSNSAGYGYLNIRETMYNPRLVQFKGSEPRVLGSVTSHLTGFGDMHDTMRKEILPGVIPAANCLDHPNAGVNLFQLAMDKGGVDGGASGIGYWLAKRLLNYIPSDYGIMILPCARGSTGFIRRGEQWKVGNVLANKLKADIVNALKMNPENKLLPVVWVQGEDDELDGEADAGRPQPQLAHDRFLELFNDIKDTLVKEKLDSRIPSVASYSEGKALHLGLKPIDYFRWICLSASSYTMFQNKWWEKYDRNYATSDKITHGMHLWNVPSANVWAAYDNYVYLMNTVKNTHDDSYILYSRVDTLPDGKFSLTDFDEMFDRDDGMREAHFGGTTYTQFMPAVVENVMLGYSKVLNGPMPSLYKYTLRGDVPATTDGVLVHFPTKAAGFDLASISKPISGNSCPLGDENFTVSLSFKPAIHRRNEFIDILVTDGVAVLSQMAGTFLGHRFNDICCKIPFSASITGAWNGGFDSWQHVVFTYNKDFRILNAYLNGKLIGTVTDHDGFAGKSKISFNNPGETRNFRVLSRDITPDESYALYLKDRV